MKLINVTVMAVALLMGMNVYAQDDTRVFPAASFKKLKVDNEEGKTTITGADIQEIRVSVRIEGNKSSCEFKTEIDGDELELKAKENSWFGSRCHVELAIEVPATLALDLEAESGDIYLSSVRSAVEVEVGSGNFIAKESDFGQISAKIGSGEMKIDGKVAIGQFRVGSGSFNLMMSDVPAAGNIDLKVGSGSGVISLPAEARINSSVQTGVGKFTSEITSVADATYRISMKVGSGDLAIKKL